MRRFLTDKIQKEVPLVFGKAASRAGIRERKRDIVEVEIYCQYAQFFSSQKTENDEAVH